MRNISLDKRPPMRVSRRNRRSRRADADSFINVFIIAAYESPCTGMTTIDRQHDSTTDAAA